jgi:hypothetical protein
MTNNQQFMPETIRNSPFGLRHYQLSAFVISFPHASDDLVQRKIP